MDDVKVALTSHKPGEIDWITIVGSGEPTLHSGLGWLIRRVKALSNLPVAVITNGSLLYMPEIRGELAAADAVLPSLDAGRPDLYRKINRPWPKLTFELLLEGLISFKKEYQGNLWVEVMLIHGVNDTEVELYQIAKALEKIQPDEIHLLQPTRPPAETWVEPASDEDLLRAQAILGPKSRVLDATNGSFEFGRNEPLLEAVISIITRHPMREEELLKTLAQYSPNDVKGILAELENSGKAKVIERYHTRFWIASPAYFPPGKPT